MLILISYARDKSNNVYNYQISPLRSEGAGGSRGCVLIEKIPIWAVQLRVETPGVRVLLL